VGPITRWEKLQPAPDSSSTPSAQVDPPYFGKKPRSGKSPDCFQLKPQPPASCLLPKPPGILNLHRNALTQGYIFKSRRGTVSPNRNKHRKSTKCEAKELVLTR